MKTYQMATSMKLNEQGYPVLDDGLHGKLFGSASRPAPKSYMLERSRRLLSKFDIPVPVDYPEGMYDGDLPFPELMGGSIEAHFEAMAGEFVDEYKALAEELSTAKLPEIPCYDDFIFQPGWTRYEKVRGEWVVEKVPHPLEKAFTFDTETFVTGGAFPVIGTALSEKASYVWLAAEMCDPSLPTDKWTQHDLIPLGSGNFVVGHNISYDRVRTRDGYTLDKSEPENFYFDTLSAHIAVSGLASGQRWLYVLAGKDPDSLSQQERKKLMFRPRWATEGSTNSLVNVYNFHVAAIREYFGEKVHRMEDADKDIRDVFVKATEMHQLANRRDLLEYAMLDAFYTTELFQALWRKYLESTPSKVALAGHMFLNGSRVPVSTDWPEWISQAEKVFAQYNHEMSDICHELIKKSVNDWRLELDKDIAAVEESLRGAERQDLITAAGLEKKKVVKIPDVLKGLDKNAGLSWTHHADAWVRRDPWLSQLDWSLRSYAGKYAYMPKWASKYLADPSERITTKSRVSHLLLRLKWEGKPVVWIENKGWCIWED